MKIRYYVCGLGYDIDLEAIDYEVEFGDFDTYEEAYEVFVKLRSRTVESYFAEATDAWKILIQLEECEETDDEIICIDVKNEWWIVNPNFEED